MKLFLGGLGASRKQRTIERGFEGYPIKLSDAVLDIAEPFLLHVPPTSAPRAERVAMLAALAWNAELAELLEPDDRAKIEQALAEATDEVRRLIELARVRKRARHPDDDRVVLGVEISGAPPSFRFRVAGSSLRPAPRAEQR